MKKNEISIHKVYAVRVSGVVVPVRITDSSEHGGWHGTNLATGKKIRIHTAGRLRCELEKKTPESKWTRVGDQAPAIAPKAD